MLGLGRARTNREHRSAAENLSAYIDGELTTAERVRLERHLATCADCRRDVETLRETVALLRRVPLKPAPRSFALPASARAVQARRRRWNAAFGVLRSATVTIATVLLLVFAGDAAFTTGLISVPGSRVAREATTLSTAPEEFTAPAEKRVEPGIAEAAPDAAPPAPSEGVAESYAGDEAPSVAEAPPPSETARALQPPRETWPGPKEQPRGGEVGGGEDAGGLGGAGGAGDMGSPVPAVPRPNGIGGGAAPSVPPAETEPQAASEAEAQAESLAQSSGATEAPDEGPQPEAIMAPTPAPTAEPEPTAVPTAEPTMAPEPTVEPEAARAPTSEAMAMPAQPEHGTGEPAEADLQAMPLDRQPESLGWQAWRVLRLMVGLLAGMLLIALAGTIWAGYKRGSA